MKALVGICGLCGLWLALMSGPALAEGLSDERIAELLFPEIKDVAWVSVSKAPVVTPSRIMALKTKLKKAYAAAVKAYPDESPEWSGCSFIERVLGDKEIGEQNWAKSVTPFFHELDVNGDGLADLLYVGDALCVDGGASALWLADKNGAYWMHAPRHHGPKGFYFWSLDILKVKPGPEPILASAIVGCCGSVALKFHLGHLFNPWRLGTRETTQGTRFPEKPLSVPVPFKSTQELILRSDSKRDEAYDESASGYFEHAIFGNILSKYLPGLCGKILAYEKDAEGQNWAFVLIEGPNGALCHHRPFSVDAGWTTADSLDLPPPVAPEKP